MLVQEPSEIRRNYIIAFLLLGGIVSLFVFTGISVGMADSSVQFEVVREGQFIKLDYAPMSILDQQWYLQFWTETKTFGSGDFAETFYPKIEYWKLYINGINDNKPIGEQDYIATSQGAIHPGQRIEFFYTFDTDNFVKGIYTCKLRVDIDNNGTDYRDMVDFQIQLEGSITLEELLWILVPTVTILIMVWSTIKIKEQMNARFWDDVKFHNAWIYFFFYLIKGKWIKKRPDYMWNPLYYDLPVPTEDLNEYNDHSLSRWKQIWWKIKNLFSKKDRNLEKSEVTIDDLFTDNIK